MGRTVAILLVSLSALAVCLGVLQVIVIVHRQRERNAAEGRMRQVMTEELRKTTESMKLYATGPADAYPTVTTRGTLTGTPNP